MLKNQKDKAFCLQMNAKIREYLACALAAYCTQYKAFAFICVLWRSFAEDMLFAFK